MKGALFNMARRRKKGKKRDAAAGILIIAAALLVLLGSELGFIDLGGGSVDLTVTALPDSGLFAAYIDVGQGDSAFLACEGETMLIDAGISSEGDTVVDYLKSRGVTELDYVVCTHAHEDHCGGLDYVLERFPVGTLFAPYTEFDSSGSFTHFEDTAAELGIDITVPEPGCRVVFADFAAGEWEVQPCSGSGTARRFTSAAGKLTGVLQLSPGEYRLIRR